MLCVYFLQVELTAGSGKTTSLVVLVVQRFGVGLVIERSLVRLLVVSAFICIDLIISCALKIQ